MIGQFLLATTLGNELKVGNALSNAHPLLMREDDAGELSTLALPVMGDSQEVRVLRHQDSVEGSGTDQQFIVRSFPCSVFLAREDIDSTTS
ncbi:MAG: hypothetical protein KatS3mg082_1990 [Nitrospiraceae bacterium]|nr:MAG: hypothetical protein KatS3mg082_1990 [Nitrospiraceae bacterium]